MSVEMLYIRLPVLCFSFARLYYNTGPSVYDIVDDPNTIYLADSAVGISLGYIRCCTVFVICSEYYRIDEIDVLDDWSIQVGVLNHHHLNCLFTSLYKLITKDVKYRPIGASRVKSTCDIFS